MPEGERLIVMRVSKRMRASERERERERGEKRREITKFIIIKV